jgi:hypothetical protein
LRSRRAVLPATVLGVAAILGTVLPSRAQQDQPQIRFTAPTTRAAGAVTRTDVEFSLPADARLMRPARVRVIAVADGRLVEFLPFFITGRGTVQKGFRGLHTESYLPGVYQVSAEVEYLHPRLGAKTAVSPAVTLTIPEPTP